MNDHYHINLLKQLTEPTEPLPVSALTASLCPLGPTGGDLHLAQQQDLQPALGCVLRVPQADPHASALDNDPN